MTKTDLVYKELSYKIQGAFFEVYKSLGNAHKEIIYHRALENEFKQNGLDVTDQTRIDVLYKGKRMGVYIPDLIINDLVLIEIKCKSMLLSNDIRQFWHYLKNSKYKLGYLVNFGRAEKVQYIRRVYDTARKN